MLFTETGIGENEEMSLESLQYIIEAMLYDTLSSDELESFLENSFEVNSAIAEEVVMEKTVVRLDKKAKLSKARKMAVFTIAREKNDPKFKKLLTLWRMERSIEQYLDKKYGNEAMRRAKKAQSTAANSKAATVQHAANKAKSMFNKPATT